jgi:predicted nucleotidyltransferase
MMTKKESDIAGIIGSRINKRDPEAEVILYGSHARGQAHDDSDWDILILINQPKQNRAIENRYRDEIFQIELEVGEPISTMIYSKADWETLHVHTPLYKNIKKEGIQIS